MIVKRRVQGALQVGASSPSLSGIVQSLRYNVIQNCPQLSFLVFICLWFLCLLFLFEKFVIILLANRHQCLWILSLPVAVATLKSSAQSELDYVGKQERQSLTQLTLGGDFTKVERR